MSASLHTIRLSIYVQLFETPWTTAYQAPLFQARELEWVAIAFSERHLQLGRCVCVCVCARVLKFHFYLSRIIIK